MREARAYLTEREKTGATLIDLVSGKQALSMMSAKCKDLFGVSFGPISLCRAMDLNDVHPEILKVLREFT